MIIRIRNGLGLSLLAAVVCLIPPAVSADVILQQYEFQGQTGSETFVAPSYAIAGLNPLNFTEANVTPSAGANSINSSGWTAANAMYSFGFTIAPGNSVTVDQLILTSRSSGTGPGYVNLLASVDGGAFTTVASITQTSTNYNDEYLSITPVMAHQSLTFEFVAANQTSAAGGTIGSTGTFRVGDYDPAGAAAPTTFTINGTVTPLASVPEPSSFVLGGISALIGAGIWMRRRRV